MPIRRLFAASLFLATAGVIAAVEPAAGAALDDAPVTPTSATAPPAADAAPPTIEVVREGEGVSDVWRREGSDFPAYGPDGQPVVPTPERQALQALANAYDVTFVALAPASPEAGGVAPCGAGGCVGGHAAVARVPVQNVAQYRLARQIGDSWLGEPAGVSVSCEPGFGHALTFSADGHAWEVLLAYGCGSYRLRRDGVEVGEGRAAEPAGRVEFDALLASAGVAAAAAAFEAEAGIPD